jgi:hypothetical protein
MAVLVTALAVVIAGVARVAEYLVRSDVPEGTRKKKVAAGAASIKTSVTTANA